MVSRRKLPDAACDEIWARINGKKYAYGFGRDQRFISRCYRIQTRLMEIQSLRRLETYGVIVDDVLEGNLILMKQMFEGRQDGSREITSRL